MSQPLTRSKVNIAHLLLRHKGGVGEKAVNSRLLRAYDDIARAPDLAQERVVTLKIKLKPVLENMECSRVDVAMHVGGKEPERVITGAFELDESGDYPMLWGNELSPDNPAQRTLDEAAPGAFAIDPEDEEE